MRYSRVSKLWALDLGSLPHLFKGLGGRAERGAL